MKQFFMLACLLFVACLNVVPPVVAAPASVQVTINAFAFNPKQVTIKKGGTVTFTNKDSTAHTVTPEGGAKFEGTGRIGKDESKTVKFDEAGVQNYFCDLHPSMKGSVNVVE
jgi:plastocyanin